MGANVLKKIAYFPKVPLIHTHRYGHGEMRNKKVDK